MHIENIIDIKQFRQQLPQQKNPLALFRQALEKGQAILKQAFYQQEPIEKIIADRSLLIDFLLLEAWHYFNLQDNKNNCLIAAGGYGRKELFPCSDVDILILCHHAMTGTLKEGVEKFLTLLWDIGLDLGHGVRTLDECITLAKEDVTVYTNLLDARLLSGEEKLFNQLLAFTKMPHALWSSDAFFNAKLAEQKIRHEKYGHSSYNLEPNVKDGPGGLRDIHTIIWVAKQKFAITHTHDLVQHHFLTEEEYAVLLQGQHYLWQIRAALHHLTERREERLLFDYQTELAHLFHFQDTPLELAIEQFMKNYYRNVKELNELNDMLLQYFDEAILNAHTKQNIVRINDRFQVVNHYIEVSHHHIFNENPNTLMEIFLHIAERPDIKGVRASTIRLLRQSRHFIDDAFRENGLIKLLFIELFKHTGNVAKPLRLMSRYGLLGKYLPQFGQLIGKMQYDLYHVYTVDRHLIAIVQNIDNFSLEEYSQKIPYCTELFKKLPAAPVLYLAGLLHDIGKGHGGDHSAVGRDIARAFCEAHFLPPHQAEVICWLVGNHLLMSNTAQRMDIYDPEVIRQFATIVSNKKQLEYLYLLTCADIIATNENLWNNWRSSLLRDLYLATKAYFLDQGVRQRKTTALIVATKREALTRLTQYDAPKIEHLWHQWSKQYFLHHSAQKVAWHTAAILEHIHLTTPLILISTYRNEGGTEIFIYVKDQPYVFANTTAALDKLHLNVVEAQIITTKDGFTLDSYIVIDKQGNPIMNEHDIKLITQFIVKQFSSFALPLSITKRQLTRRQRHFSYPAKVSFQLDEKKNRTLIEVISPDRPGVLARVGLAFKECNIYLQHAKIATLGDRVEDLFYITDQDHQPLISPAKQEKLKERLCYYLDHY